MLGPVDLLPLMAEVSIAITGFAGLVSVFGTRSAGKWAMADLTRLISLLSTSLSAFLLSIFALSLLSVTSSTELIWRLMSLLVIIERVAWLARFVPRFGHIRASGQTIIFAALFAVVGVIMILVSTANFLVWQAYWPFLACIVLYIVEASFVFVRLVIYTGRDIVNP